MSGKGDPFWSYVVGMAEGSFKCFFCGNVFAAKVSITRIKHHLAKLRGGGSRPCEEVPPHVQQAAVDNILNGSMSTWVDSMTGGNVAPGMPMPDAPETGLGTEPADQPFEMDMNNISSSLMQSVVERGSSSKRPVDRSVPSSSNNEATNAASTPFRALAIEQEGQPLLDSLIWGENLVTDAASTPVRGLAIEKPLLDDGLGGMDILIGGETELVEEPTAAVVLMTEEPETRQRTGQAHQSFETNTKSISSSSMMDDVLRMCRSIMSQEYKPSVVERGSSSESPAHKRRRTRRYVLPTTKLVGQAFERNMKDVWSWLLNDEVSSIGIYGMGGVGKTAFATHIHNQLRHVCQERQDIFHHVCWITVSQDFSIEALQDGIVEYFDLDLGDQKDAVVRARKLCVDF